MNREQFNKYCAEVMGYKVDYSNKECNGGYGSYFTKHKKWKLYNPYDDLNQMAEVFDKKFKPLAPPDADEFIVCCVNKGIKQAMRNFIESTNREAIGNMIGSDDGE